MKKIWMRRAACLGLSLIALPAFGNIIGSEFQNFNPSLSVTDYATVHSSRTIGKGKLGLGLFVNQANNTLPYFDADEATPDVDASKRFKDSVTGLDLTATYGVLDNWDLSLTVPYMISQVDKKSDIPHGYFERLGVTEVRIASKVQILDASLFHLGLVGTANYNRVQDNPYSGNVPWPSASLEVVLGSQVGIFDWSVNLGRRWRHTEYREDLQEELPVKPFGDQWLASTALAIDLPKTKVDLIGEIYGAEARRDFSKVSARSVSIAESMVGIRYPLPYDLQFHAGVGGELNHSMSSADVRVYTGIRWITDLGFGKKEEAPVLQEKTVEAIPAHFDHSRSGVLDRSADVILELDDIYFLFDSTEIRDPRGYKVMEQLSQALQAQPIERVIIEGNACALGTEAYNFNLSENRAERIERMLINEYGVAPEKLVSVGYGETRPKFSNKEEATRMLNRRVTFKIFYRKAMARTPSGLAH